MTSTFTSKPLREWFENRIKVIHRGVEGSSARAGTSDILVFCGRPDGGADIRFESGNRPVAGLQGHLSEANALWRHDEQS